MKPGALFSVITLVLGGLALVAPIAWDQYKSAAALELRQESSASLIEKTAALDKLEIRYGSRPVDRITQLSFTLANTGRTPIRESDIVSPLTLDVGSAEVLDARVERVDPAELSATVATDATNHAVTIRFPLLNPKDVVYLNVLVVLSRDIGDTAEWRQTSERRVVPVVIVLVEPARQRLCARPF